MAIPVSLTITIKDGKNENSVVEIFLPSATTLTDAQAFWAGFDNLFDALIDGGVVSASVSFPLALPIGINIADPLSDVQEGALFVWETAQASLTKKSLTIPTIKEALFVAGTKLINTAHADVAAFLTAMLSGIGGVEPVAINDLDLGALRTAREAWGKYRP